MISPFLSFPADTLDPTKLEQILTRYLAYERLQSFRSRLLPRFAVLLLAIWSLTSVLHVFSPTELWTVVILVGALTGAVLLAEFRARQQLVRELRNARR